MNREPKGRQNVAAIIPSYVVLWAIQSKTDEPPKQLISEVVRECGARYQRLMYSVIQATGVGHENIEDVIQDILLRWTRMLKTRRRLPAPGALTAWFRKVARNAGVTHMRRLRGKRMEAEEVYGFRRLAADDGDPLFDCAMRELPKVIDGILMANATPEMSGIFKLWRQGLTYPEIAAKIQGRSAEGVRNVLRKVRTLLRKGLIRQGWSIP